MKNDESTELHEGDEAPPPGTRAAAAVRWIIIALSALIAFGAVASHCGLIQCGGSTAKRALYHCPMHPSVIQESPGDCPICGMSLVPVEGPSEAKSAAQDDAPPPETGAGLEPGHE